MRYSIIATHYLDPADETDQLAAPPDLVRPRPADHTTVTSRNPATVPSTTTTDRLPAHHVKGPAS